MKMLLTRLGENSRLVITGDLEQYDRMNELNGLEDFLNKFRGRRSSSISSFEFNKNDIQREEVVREILDIYSAVDLPLHYLENSENHDCADNVHGIEEMHETNENKGNKKNNFRNSKSLLSSVII
jgi:hypothetical protein